MWLIIITIAAVIATILWYFKKSYRHKLSSLMLILWGASIMFFIDHVFSYLEEGEFLEISLDATLLGIVLLITTLVIWGVYTTLSVRHD